MEECDTPLLGTVDRFPRPIDQAGHFGITGNIARTLKPYTEADQNAIIVQCLVLLGNFIGRRVYYLVGTSSRHYANEFVLTVGRSSKARKGTSLNDVQGAVDSGDGALKVATFSTALSSGEGLVNAVRDPVDEEDAGISDKRCLFVVSEFSGTFKAVARTGNNLAELACEAWDGKESPYPHQEAPGGYGAAHFNSRPHDAGGPA